MEGIFSPFEMIVYIIRFAAHQTPAISMCLLYFKPDWLQILMAYMNTISLDSSQIVCTLS